MIRIDLDSKEKEEIDLSPKAYAAIELMKM